MIMKLIGYRIMVKGLKFQTKILDLLKLFIQELIMGSLIRKLVIALVTILLFSFYQNPTLAQVGITFNFENPVYSNVGGMEYFDFDITARASENSQFKIAQIYVDYNTLGFGSSLVSNGRVSITEGELLNDVSIGTFGNGGYGDYSVSVQDNTSSRLAIQNFYSRSIFGSYLGRGYELTNTLGTTSKVYVHVKLTILDATGYSGLSFNSQISQWDLQNYYFTTPFTDNQTIYAPVDVTATLNTPIGDPLPVELISFVGKVKDKDVLLSWKTATEINNYGFNIERKDISKQNLQNDFHTISFIAGNGNSNSPKEYSYIDHDLQSGIYAYRLKQIDSDGQFEYSPVINVEISAPVEYELSQNYPNPFNPSTTIKFTIPEAGLVKLSVLNLLGQEIKTIVDEHRQAGIYNEKFDATELNSGVYFYELKVNHFIQTKKMLFLK